MKNAGETLPRGHPALRYMHKGWNSRGYLPHFDSAEVVQMITFRLCDSLPAEVWIRWKAKLEREETEKEKRRVKLHDAAENYLDKGYGCCLLRQFPYAQIVENAILHFDKERYWLMGWVIMPNHVHVLAEMREGYSLGEIIHSWKSFTAHEIGKLNQTAGTLWQADYFDRFMRDESHFHRAMHYIENNPVKAGLCLKPEDWPFSSARFR